ncbi:MAG TPA: entericidin A/B family lipoprotein [Usitatibacter sp.]|nr:entericidin A/B family lipoprotein [Usitatibacter sp.]
MAFSAAFFGTLTGCNTMEGVGKDVEKGGKEIKEEAQEHKKY